MGLTDTEVRSMLEKSYSPTEIPKLEEYLEQACRGEAAFIFDAVRRLIKLYVLFPASSKATTKNMGYASLLTFVKCNDNLLALRYLIPMAKQQQEPFKSVFQCSAYLTACNFADFWKTFVNLQTSDDVLVQKTSQAAVSHFQQTILEILALSYKKAPVSIILAALNVKTLPSTLSIEDDTVVFTATAENTKRERVYQEGINFGNVTLLLHKMGQ